VVLPDGSRKALRLRLDLARAKGGDDPYAFRFRAQEYHLRDCLGVVRSAELSTVEDSGG
jgi:hypothetical protein